MAVVAGGSGPLSRAAMTAMAATTTTTTTPAAMPIAWSRRRRAAWASAWARRLDIFCLLNVLTLPLSSGQGSGGAPGRVVEAGGQQSLPQSAGARGDPAGREEQHEQVEGG